MTNKRTAAWPLVALLFSALSLVVPGFTYAAEDDEDEALVEEVVVTGSRVRRSDFTSTSPITVISGQSLIESGFSDISEHCASRLQQVPAASTSPAFCLVAVRPRSTCATSARAGCSS